MISAPRPISACGYFDKIALWLAHDIDKKTEDLLRRECGKGGFHKALGPSRFDARLRCRLELKQPSDRAIACISAMPGALVNSVEIALDLSFRTAVELYEAADFAARYLVRRWHSERQGIRRYASNGVSEKVENIASGTRYDGSRSAPNRTVMYQERFCRITGELFCLHLEWRVNGAAAVRRAGISRSSDLIRFDHRSFWEKRLLFRRVSPERLGLAMNNRQAGTKRRSANRRDRKVGSVMLKSRPSMQEVIDRWGSMLRLHRILVPIPAAYWLPPARPSLICSYEKDSPTRRNVPNPDPDPSSSVVGAPS